MIRIFVKLLEYFFRIFGKKKSYIALSVIAEKIAPVINVKTKLGEILFYGFGGIPSWRAETLLTKEPETISWIDAFDVNDIFWDIGANIGVFTLYAAKKNIKVLAFEPSPSNYFLLNKNIELNNASNNVSAICLAFNNTTKLDFLHMSDTRAGSAHSSFSENIDQYGKVFTPVFELAMLGFSVDDFYDRFSPNFPNHIKIDVDGIEDKIIFGAEKVFSNPNLKSVLIELDPDRPEYTNKIVKKMNEYGLRGDFIKGQNASGYNAIFYRKT